MCMLPPDVKGLSDDFLSIPMVDGMDITPMLGINHMRDEES